ncbi:Hypothetical protein HDN1F_12860 [gamma proteobacterium HdN1]|nr:Hypothetical protein HDN1F_12860 [gamma proteobacterium HdN1]
MASSRLEIIELPSGEIVLRRTDGEGEPFVRIQFSNEAKVLLGDASLDLGKAMIGAGVQIVGHMYSRNDQPNQDEDEAEVIELEDWQDVEGDFEFSMARVVH